MDDAAPYSTYNTQRLDSAQLQMSDQAQDDHDYLTHLVVEGVGQSEDHGWSAVEAANWREGSEVAQAMQLDLEVGLASMNLNGTPTGTRTQPATAATVVESSPIVDTNISAGAVLDACTALKNELDAALNAYRQSREVMLWHAANVCRVNMEYIHALRVMNHVQG
ncbi:hypothetical protein GSI_11919 [Ganoderma sinense ZZ0214-1]|uniref:Uncharacterized protein n=1 Tax=Ganoderma sinense ZZ0214-1 TaxID=1077348 RepID=A0A2G8RXE7_9APHY|nr:hypothetical protein GSI_11919 [Ganoderma sinense ZZ0214-1]